jgi:hypothetical protein
MLFNPFWGMVISMVLDMIDWHILGFSGLKHKYYHEIDKPLDYIQYLFLIPLVFNTTIFEPYILLLAWRTIGQVMFSKFNTHRIFILFPNIAEYLAFLYFFRLEFSLNFQLDDPSIVFGLIIFKLAQESILHIPKWGYTWGLGNNLRKQILGETHRKNI